MIRYALLALLTDGADHGYRLKRRLDARLGPVWHVNAGQIYRALEQLRRARWVEELPPDVERGGGHERWPVAITPAGAAELDRWLDDPIPPEAPSPPRPSELLARLVVGGWESLPRVLEGIDTEREAILRARVRVERDRSENERDESPSALAGFLALEASRLELEARLAWLDVFRERVARVLETRKAAGA